MAWCMVGTGVHWGILSPAIGSATVQWGPMVQVFQFLRRSSKSGFESQVPQWARQNMVGYVCPVSRQLATSALKTKF